LDVPVAQWIERQVADSRPDATERSFPCHLISRYPGQVCPSGASRTLACQPCGMHFGMHFGSLESPSVGRLTLDDVLGLICRYGNTH
jgi:hypothetical protein